MPLSAGEKDSGRPTSRQFPQCVQAGFGERRTVYQGRLGIHVEPPRRATTAITVGRKQPEIRPNLLRRTAWLQRGGHHRHDGSPQLSLL